MTKINCLNPISKVGTNLLKSNYEITDKLVEAIRTRKYDFLRINFPNGDMVGHTGNYEKTIEAIEAVDNNLGRIMKAVDEVEATLIVIADHGNAEEMYQLKEKSKKEYFNWCSSHTIFI